MFQKRKASLVIMLFSMMAFSIIAHLFFIIMWQQGFVMKGINDGLSQMLPFKQFIYDKYVAGDFFYAADFGLGGGFFSSIAYYFTTNLFFLPWVLLTWLASMLIGFTPNFEYWAALVIPMSIVKQTAVFYVAYLFLRKVTNMPRGAYVGAAVYALSPFFFRHEVYWDILTDSLFWVPLMLLGIEKIIRKESSLLFILAVALVMISNFYLSYMTLLIGAIYAIARMFYHFTENEQSVKQQLWRYIGGGVLAAGIASFAFIPAAYSFIGNVRPPYKDAIKLFDINDDIFTNPRVLWVPVFIFVLFFVKELYQHRLFRFFAVLSIVGIMAHFIPYVGSMFNGFSAPQQRWESIIILSFGAMLAIALNSTSYWHFKRWPLIAAILSIMTLFLYKWLSPDHAISNGLIIISLLWLAFFIVFYYRKWAFKWLAVSIVIVVLIEANIFSANLANGGEGVATKSFIYSQAYHAHEQENLVQWMQQQLTSTDNRIDWLVPTRNNTPMVQDFKGTSVYSSILNGDLLHFYLRDLQIDMGRESVSRYGTLGNRTNLMALEQVQFYMRPSSDESVPYGYELAKQTTNYRAYENTDLLPVFRVTNESYNEQALEKAPVLAKEQAMLKGVIREAGTITAPEVATIPIKQTKVEGATWVNNELIVDRESGHIQLTLDTPKRMKTLYVQMHIEGIKHPTGFTLQVNEYKTTRKKSNSIYRTGFNDVTVAVNAAKTVTITLPKGHYQLGDLAIYGEDYQTLDKALERKNTAQMIWDNGKAFGEVTAQDGDVLATSIPYGKGWRATVDGKKVTVEKVNYAFVGIPLEKGKHTVEFTYLPPYWPIAAWLSILSVLVLLVLRIYKAKKMN